MSQVVIKTVNRKTTIAKAAIKKAAKIAYGSSSTANQPGDAHSKASAKARKAA